MKFGGSSLKDAAAMREICEIIKKNGFSKRVVAQSAVNGVTNLLIQAMAGALESESRVEASVQAIRAKHDPLILKDCQSQTTGTGRPKQSKT